MTAAADYGTTRTTYETWVCEPACGVPTAPSEPTPWGRFLDHAMGCADCRAGQRCATGHRLLHAVREALTAAAP
ncbi:hypothetical protein HUT19_22580 [Streptomyces sp. NA02950]|uniref:hypothetical protein n=1 Tax=Streptomyces sp. NA02950 TaxID=2742137 RepID=UPI00158FA7DE|nr:hypothetical protein [Streptomyces sp. NA02950]QKV94204.1 hypothetical protein HUT19_22580 [Streptomyces sp. NA02950]